MKRILKITGLIILIILLIGYLIPQRFAMPVDKATKADYNSKTFWYYPWGKSVTHKGIDVFAKKGTKVFSSTPGIVVYKGEVGSGGKVVLVLGPKWRFHYYAHLDEINTSVFCVVNSRKVIGTVGDSGNAVGKPAHLHYSIVTPVPYPWRIDGDRQGWKKMFYLNPLDYLKN